MDSQYIDQLLSTKVVQEYIATMKDGLRNTFSLLDEDELEEAILYSITQRAYNGKTIIHNNYTGGGYNVTVLDVLKYIEKVQPIITSSGVLFQKHKDADNPLSRMIMGFLKKRAEYKKMMFKYPKGSEEYEKYNLSQLLEKLNANATYGVLGNATSMFYNLYVAEGITRQGRSYISCSIMLFESLLANNVKFNNIDEVITLIHNVQSERPKRKLLDEAILDRDVSIAECFFKVMNTADMFLWIPTEEEMSLVWSYLCDLTQEDINRIYYKNNLYEFCDSAIVSELMVKILCNLQEPFMDPNEPPKEIKEDLDTLVELIKEYVYYPHFYVDKLDRIEYMQRDVVCICDELRPLSW